MKYLHRVPLANQKQFVNLQALFSHEMVNIEIPKPFGAAEVLIRRSKGSDIKLHSYLPSKINKKLRTLVIFPGCGSEGSEMAHIAHRFQKKGFFVFSATYSAGAFEDQDFKNYTISQMLKDIKEVIDYVYNHVLVDKKEIYVIGHSLGSFSSLLYLSRHKDKRVRAVIGISPVIDIIDVGFNHAVAVAETEFENIADFLKGIIYFIKGLVKDIIFRVWRFFGKITIVKKNNKWVTLSVKFLEDILHHHKKEKVLEDLKSLEHPVLLLLGAKDQWVRFNNVLEIYNKMRPEIKAISVVKDVGHFLLDNEGIDNLTEVVDKWIEANKDNGPSLFSAD
jgi:alpha-beta hydrolase superfamily lysophospholipase